jgi:hypothetical protein
MHRLPNYSRRTSKPLVTESELKQVRNTVCYTLSRSWLLTMPRPVSEITDVGAAHHVLLHMTQKLVHSGSVMQEMIKTCDVQHG